MPHPSLGSEQGSFMPHSTVNLSDEETLKAEEEEDLLTAFQDIDKSNTKLKGMKKDKPRRRNYCAIVLLVLYIPAYVGL